MLHPKMSHVYIGVDVHRFTHTAVIINCFNEKLGSVTFKNKPSEFNMLLKEVRKHTSLEVTACYGLEDVVSSGRELAGFLLAQKQKVKYVNASLTFSERKNKTVYHKDDEFDGLCIARVLLNRLQDLPDAQLDDRYWALSELVSKRNTLIKANVALKNQLHTYLGHHYHSYKNFFYQIEGKAALEFWQTYPSPSKLEGVSQEDLGKFLKLHSVGAYGEKKAAEILDSIKENGDITYDFQSIRDAVVSTTAIQIKENAKYIKQIEAEIRILLPSFGYKLETMPGINMITAANLIAEIGNIDRFPKAANLANYAGISPVRYSSGQTDKNLSNRLGDRALNQIFFKLAVITSSILGNNTKPTNKLLHEYYKKKISEGKTKKQGLKCVMRKLVNIVYHLMKNKSEYIEPDIKE